MDLARQLITVALVLGLLLLTLWILRRKGLTRFVPAVRGRNQRHVVLIERLPLSAQHAVHLLRVADRALLIGTGPSGCTLIEGFAWKDVKTGESGSGRMLTEG
jgi:flagellar biogenesis protein FliO